MKMKHLILVIFLAIGQHFCLAQSDSVNNQLNSTKFTLADTSPYYVLKVDDKSVAIDKHVDTQFDLDSIDPNWIKEIQVLKGFEAKSDYGERGKNGVVIIYFKDFNTLPPELQARFNGTK
jgi:hypothetical protein